MKKKILIPTDFSDNAWAAVVYTLHLYKDVECKFYFLHSTKMSASTMSNLSNKLLKVMTNSALKELNDLKAMAEHSNSNSNHEFEITLSVEDLSNAIERAISKYSIDLIIMGTKGASGKSQFLFGTHTIRAIKKIKNCPIFIVPEEFDFSEPKQIAFPTDFKHFFDEELLPLKQLAELYNSKIRVVHISEEEELSDVQNYNLTMLQSYLKDHAVSIHWMPNYAKKTQEINDFIEELGIDILVMINYKHSLIEKIVREPVVKKIGFNPVIPVLVVPYSR
ncbi:MAG: universal stress protein [Winogradskyella sp.]|uniref:universal stress protein n=1 Tax=Winogradskyella sp. TaxID=1883156 RepID=UPI00185E86BF|nr:universal stress protein [Winogradskyella sp.]